MRKTFSESLLPPGWSLCLFGDIVENHDGVRIPLKAEDRSQRQGGYPYYGASGIIDHIDDYLFDGDFLLIAEDGANLLARSSPAAFKASGRFWVNNHAHVIQPKSGVSLEWLHRFFEVLDLEPFVTGSAQPKLAQGNLNRILVPLPPLAEQQRIAAILDKADALRTKRRAALAKLDTLLQATFLHMFGDPVTNPMGWDELRIGEVINDIVTGESYGGEQTPLEADEMGVLKISAVTTGEFIPTEYKAVKISDIRNDVIKPRKGDLLFSRANTREMVAATCIVDRDYDHIFLPDKLWRIDFDHNRCTNWYFKYLLSHEGFRNRLTKTATGTSGSMLNISQAKLRSLLVPLPPIGLQKKFDEFANSMREQKNRFKKTLQELDNLFHSLQQRAFKGEL